MDTAYIRNFSIIAHIDHGKSTLADRLMEKTQLVSSRKMKEQYLDNMDLEREKGITIKARAVRMDYTAEDGTVYQLNMIDTPGHVDFSYEVSKSLAACEGALLVVDAAQGVEAQTVANVHMAFGQELAIIPLINKVDLPNADPDKIRHQLEDVLAIEGEHALPVSSKTGKGVEEVLEAIVRDIPAPSGDPDTLLQALVFDSTYDNYRGVIVYVRLMNGAVKKGQRMRFMGMGTDYDVLEVGVFAPEEMPVDSLSVGEVGYIISNIKDIADVRVGDTITDARRPAKQALPGYKEAKSMVFAGLYPVNSVDYELLRDALNKLKLNDSALQFESESSPAIGFGFRCGFLGLLHMEIIQERIEREYGLAVIVTVPNVEYHLFLKDGSQKIIDNPSLMPEPHMIETITEPMVEAIVVTPSDYIGGIMSLMMDRRGVYVKTEYLDTQRVILTYTIPLSEIIMDFYDKLKSITRGYASFDYEFTDYAPSKLVKLDVLVNSTVVDPLSIIVAHDKAADKGRKLIEKLKELIPRQLFEIVIQAAIGNKIVARTQVRALRKNVTAKCYGGDITRKRKLIERQKEGKKRMKQIGNVQIPQEAFLAVLSVDN